MPFSWTGVRLHTPGAGALRVRLTPTGPDAVTLRVTTADGRPVATVAGLTLRPLPDSRGWETGAPPPAICTRWTG